MRSLMPIVSIVLALIAAGCIGYIAWELTSEDNHPQEPDENTLPNND